MRHPIRAKMFGSSASLYLFPLRCIACTDIEAQDTNTPHYMKKTRLE